MEVGNGGLRSWADRANELATTDDESLQIQVDTSDWLNLTLTYR